MKKYYYLVLFVVINLSCSKGIKNRELTADFSISIDRNIINKDVSRKASLYVEDIQYIALETNSENIIGDITKAILTSDYIHIFDQQTNNIYQFSHNGKFIRKIGIMGEGPNEYIRISTFSVSPNTGHITIYCDIKQSIIEFTSEGVPISEKQLGFVCADFIHYKEGYMFYGGRLPNQNIFKDIFPEQYRLIYVGSDNEIVDKYFPTTYNEALLNTSISSERNCLYYVHNMQLRFLEKPNNMVYNINTMEEIYKVDFQKQTIPVDFFYDNTISQKDIKKIEKGDYCYLSSLVESDSYIYLTYVVNKFNGIQCQAIHRKETNETINIGPVWVNDIDNILMPDIISSFQNYFIGYFEAYNFKKMIDTNINELNQKIKDLGRIVNDTDNPIICIVKMKDTEL